MKLCCFVILVFISVTFTAGEGEWGIGGIRGVESLPTPSTNEVISISQLPHSKHFSKSLVHKQLEKNFQEEQEERQVKHPAQIQNQTSQTNQTNQTKFSGNNNKGKDNDHQQSEDNNDNTNTAKKLEEEAQTINRVIVVLGSLGASLLLVAIAIAVLYWKVRRQQKLVRLVEFQEDIAKGLSNGGENTCGNTNGDDDNDNNENGNGSGNGKRDDGGGGVGNGETSINISENDGNESLFTINKKPIIIDSNAPSDIVGDDIEPQRTVIQSIQLSSPRPTATAPPIEKIEGSNELDDDEHTYSAPDLAAPPAYTPTAPPIYALQYMPIDDSSTILTYQFSHQEDSINSGTNNSNGTYIRIPPVAYAAGTTSQTNTPTNNTQQSSSHSTIIQANPSSTTNLNSSSNSGGNNDDNNRPTNQRLTI